MEDEMVEMVETVKTRSKEAMGAMGRHTSICFRFGLFPLLTLLLEGLATLWDELLLLLVHV